MIITIDGPAGTGKTTVARKVAEKLGYAYFDTGAMYRSLTHLVLKNNIALDDTKALETLLSSFSFAIKGNVYLANGEDVSEVIRTPEVTSHVSAVSALPVVRNSLIHIQQDFAAHQNSVFEGRDMGTVIFPNADVKVFLTARPAVRAERRYLELKEKQEPTSEKEVLDQIQKRDHLDSTRELSPLKQADDAHLVDTSDMTLDQVIDHVIALIQK